MTTLTGRKILVLGPTGQVGLPVARAMAAAGNDVWGAARFRSRRSRAAVEEAGVRCVPVDLVAGDLSGLPGDFDYVLNFAVAKTNDWDADLASNAEALGLVMAHCRRARAFLHCSSTAVYEPVGHRPLRETDPFGDSHRVIGLMTYSITKVAAEAVAKLSARLHGLPTTIARLNVPYGDAGGWPLFQLEMMLAGMDIPVHPDAPNLYNPIHEEDIVAQIPGLLEAASVPATVVNWGGREQVSVEDWCAYLGGLTGVTPKFVSTEQSLSSTVVDLTRLHSIVSPSAVDWKDGFKRMVAAHHPELLGEGV